MLAVFSGKIPDWIVQMPAARHGAMTVDAYSQNQMNWAWRPTLSPDNQPLRVGGRAQLLYSVQSRSVTGSRCSRGKAGCELLLLLPSSAMSLSCIRALR